MSGQFHNKNTAQIFYLTSSADTMGAEASSSESRTGNGGKSNVSDNGQAQHLESSPKRHSKKMNTHRGPRMNRIVSGNHSIVVHRPHTLPKPGKAYVEMCSSAESRQESNRRRKKFSGYVDSKNLQQDLVIGVDGPVDSNSPDSSTNSLELKLSESSEEAKSCVEY
jgi:hypothetical protein